MEYTFNQYSRFAKEGICHVLHNMTKDDATLPVFVCIGSDLVIGDSLAPLVGTMLREKNAPAFVYGSLQSTVTAKELSAAGKFIRQTNPKGKRIVIDAAVGDRNELGLIKVRSGPLTPGSGVHKKLPPIGDISILGIVAERSVLSYSLSDLTRLKMVYCMAQTISDAVCLLLNRIKFVI